MPDHMLNFLLRHEEGGEGVYICSVELGHRVYMFSKVISHFSKFIQIFVQFSKHQFKLKKMDHQTPFKDFQVRDD